ncbi:hypothetical protein JNUCC64_14640 [Streptomyces sp. JNUCC 64]
MSPGPAFEDLRQLLGEPGFLSSDPEPWRTLERETGARFPEDFRRFADAYGPVLINDQLSVFHPATTWFNLGDAIREEPGLWADPPEDPGAPEDPAPSARPAPLAPPANEVRPGNEVRPHWFGTGPGRLFPWGHATTGQTPYFRVPRDASDRWRIGVIDGPGEEAGYTESDQSFTEWMWTYLTVDDEERALRAHHFPPDGPFFHPLPQP